MLSRGMTSDWFVLNNFVTVHLVNEWSPARWGLIMSRSSHLLPIWVSLSGLVPKYNYIVIESFYYKTGLALTGLPMGDVRLFPAWA